MRKLHLTLTIFLAASFGFLISAEAVDKTKLIIGGALIAGGALISYEAVDDSILDDSGDAQFWAGTAVAGAGAVLVVLGLSQNNKNQMLMDSNKKAWEVGVGVAPRRGGFSAGMSLRW
jgi:hypothetical protein